eukprot:357713-Chlamydomonas_euryale.AAC.8
MQDTAVADIFTLSLRGLKTYVAWQVPVNCARLPTHLGVEREARPHPGSWYHLAIMVSVVFAHGG